MTSPQFGRTCEAHIQELMGRIDAAKGEAFARLTDRRRLKPLEREQVRRTLAGVVADCEAIRVWLDCGAPR